MSKADKEAFLLIPFVVLTAMGVAWAGSQGGYTIAGIPIFALCVVLAFIFQWLAFIPAYHKKTQSFYDLTGSVTNVTVIGVSIMLTPVVDSRAWLLAGIIVIWAVRLGYFLFTRIRISGEDRRFREITVSFPRFLLAWTLQGLWVALTLAAALAAITSMRKVGLDLFALAGLLVWLVGFGIEVVADRQKRSFNANPDNKDKFIRTGIWSWSRHPNHFGEIVLWIGVAIIALPVLRGWQWLTLISPVFVTILLTRISGIPMLETHADKKWGGQPDYEAYKARTSVLIPRPPSNK
jgi:steroid 5-alpha reductase family enzyme